MTRPWQALEQGTLSGKAGIELSYARLIHPQERGAIVIANGRIEAYLKYRELVDDLYRYGYSIYLWDHRGQGLSERLLEDRHIGHVDAFDDYIDDMHTIVEQIVVPANHSQLFLMGHSMGGAIATLYLDRHPGHFQAAALTAPMFGIQAPYPKWLLIPLLALLDKISPESYVPGGKGYDPVPFERNELTDDPVRYAAFRSLYHRQPELQLGSPSVRWVRQAIAAVDRIRKVEVATPTLVLQAAADSVVDNQAQAEFCRRNQQPLVPFEGALHELLVERDNIRDQVIKQVLLWFQRHEVKAEAESA